MNNPQSVVRSMRQAALLSLNKMLYEWICSAVILPFNFLCQCVRTQNSHSYEAQRLYMRDYVFFLCSLVRSLSTTIVRMKKNKTVYIAQTSEAKKNLNNGGEKESRREKKDSRMS